MMLKIKEQIKITQISDNDNKYLIVTIGFLIIRILNKI